MKEERISNYVKLCEEWAQRFLKMDQADLHKRVPELKEETGFSRSFISEEDMG